MFWFCWVFATNNSKLKTLVMASKNSKLLLKTRKWNISKVYPFIQRVNVSPCRYRTMKLLYAKNMSLLWLPTLRLTQTESDVSVIFKAEFRRSKPIGRFHRLLTAAALVEGRWSSMAEIRPPKRCPMTQIVLLELHVLLDSSSSWTFFLFAL